MLEIVPWFATCFLVLSSMYIHYADGTGFFYKNNWFEEFCPCGIEDLEVLQLFIVLLLHLSTTSRVYFNKVFGVCFCAMVILLSYSVPQCEKFEFYLAYRRYMQDPAKFIPR
jgi:hypothetical protein